jgi:hypothetical protein
VEVDGRIVTGKNPKSGAEAGAAFRDVLRSIGAR